jgi:hypothetical protein
VKHVRYGMNVEYGGRTYDILELPAEAFIHLVGLTPEQFRRIDRVFADYWPEDTVRKRHILEFAAEQMGSSVPEVVFVHGDRLVFDDHDLRLYIEQHTQKGHRLC